MNGSEFRKIRESLGLTERELADFLGYSKSRGRLRIVEIETDRVPMPRYLDKLMVAYRDGYVPKGGFK